MSLWRLIWSFWQNQESPRRQASVHSFEGLSRSGDLWVCLWEVKWRHPPPLTTGATIPWAAVLDWTKRRKWAECEHTSFSASWLWAQCGLKTATMIDTVTWFLTGDLSVRMDYVLELWAKNKPSSEFFWWSILSRQWDRTLIQFPTEREIWPSCPCSWLRPYHFIWNVTFKKLF